MKTFSEKDVLTYADLNKAKEYINKKGYFGYTLRDIQEELNRNKESKILIGINSESCLLFISDKQFTYGFFLPEDKVIEDKPVTLVRPFHSYAEFIKNTHINNLEFVRFRDKESKIETSAMIVGFQDDEKKPWESVISLGGRWFSYQTLFDNAEILIDDKWSIFGVEE